MQNLDFDNHHEPGQQLQLHADRLDRVIPNRCTKFNMAHSEHSNFQFTYSHFH